MEEERFGPWMMVEQQKGRGCFIEKVRNDGSCGASGGSRFAMLGDLGGENHATVNGEIDDENEERNLEHI